jgi:hypothetical protein
MVWDRWARGKFPNFLFLKPSPPVDGMIAQISLKQYLPRILGIRKKKTPEPGYLTAGELKDPRPTPPGKGESGGKMKLRTTDQG